MDFLLVFLYYLLCGIFADYVSSRLCKQGLPSKTSLHMCYGYLVPWNLVLYWEDRLIPMHYTTADTSLLCTSFARAFIPMKDIFFDKKIRHFYMQIPMNVALMGMRLSKTTHIALLATFCHK
jgi:hypothetical protein